MYKKYKGSEDDFQISVAQYLDSLNLLWFHCGNERKTTIRVNKKGKFYTPEGNKLKRKGVKSGVLDVIIDEPNKLYNGLRIELKVGYNKPNENQKYWIEQWNMRGYYATWTNSLDKFIYIVDSYLNDLI